MKNVFGSVVGAFALTTVLPDTAAAQQGMQGGQTTSQPGRAEQQGAQQQGTGTQREAQAGQADPQGRDQGTVNANQQNELPSTASPLALTLLAGLASLAGGLFLRRSRR